MDDATVDADLFGDPTPSSLSDQLLGNVEALAEQEAAAAAESRRASESLSQLDEPEWRTSRRLHKTEISVPVDFRALDYVTEIDENLYCPICHSPLVSPVTLRCEHQFCDECLRSALDSQSSRSKTCPACRGATSLSCIGPAPKVVTRMLDDAKVRCPLRNRGCTETLERGIIQNHVDLYCQYGETDCSAPECDLKIQRRFALGPCLHSLVSCPNCSEEVMEKDMGRHQRTTCDASYSPCPDCKEWFPLSQIEGHVQACPEGKATCAAAPYGCDFTCRRRLMPTHHSTCPLNKLVPFLEKQKARLDEHEAALTLFRRKTAVYEEGLANVQSALSLSSCTSLNDNGIVSHRQANHSNPSPSSSSSFDASLAQLLELHDSVQAELVHVKQSIADLDAKTEVALLNQAHHANEEKLYRNAMEGQVRKQLQWLVNIQLQSQDLHQQQQSQRNAMLRSATEAGPSVLKKGAAVTATGVSMLGRGSAYNSSSNSNNNSSDEEGEKRYWRPRRRSSESVRQETKL